MKHKATAKEFADITESFAVNVVEIGVEPRMLACMLDAWINEVAKAAAGPDRPEWSEKQRLLMQQFRKFKVTPLPEAEMERRRQPVGQAAGLYQGPDTRGHARVLPVRKSMLVGHGEGPVVAGDGILRHRGRFAGAEGPGVDEGEVRHIEEVVGQEPGRGAGHQGGELPHLERGIVGLGDRAERRDRFLGGQEHETVRFDQPGGT